MAQTLHVTVDGGVGGGAVITAKLDGTLFFNAIGSAPDNLTYDNYIGTIQTNSGVLDLLVVPPADNTGTLVIKLSGALVQNINVVAAGSTTGSGYNNFVRSIPLGELPRPISPELSEYFDIVDTDKAFFSGQDIVVTDAARITIKKLPEEGSIDFNVHAQESLYFSDRYFLLYAGGSYLRYFFTGAPAVAADVNGVYVDPLNVSNEYIGVLTCQQDPDYLYPLPATMTFCPGTWSPSIAPPADYEDPYNNAGTSGTGGSGGSFDLRSDSIDFPALPTLSAVDTGLVSVYNPTLAQLKALANFLWNADPTDVDWWKKLVANPLDLILGLSIVPVAVPDGTAQNIKVGLIDTGVLMTKAASQFVEVDCGSIKVDEFWGSALDYSPFRRFSIYLPFIGTRTISTDDIMGKTVEVRYHVDLLSGACTAMVKCGDAVLYQYSGACAVSLPLTGETFTNVITSTIQLAASIGATVATGGAASGITAASAANSLMSMKPIIERAGGVSGAAGQLGVMSPYLIGEIPRQSVPDDANKFIGYPSNIMALIGELSGFTSVDIIHMENVFATNAEKAELDRILKEGVIL